MRRKLSIPKVAAEVAEVAERLAAAWRVTFVPVDSRPIVRVFPHDWPKDGDSFASSPKCEISPGAIVQVFPPAGISPVLVEAARESMSQKAHAVVMMPAATSEKAVVRGSVRDQAKEAAREKEAPTVRIVVSKMVEDAKTEHRAELAAFVDAMLSAEGL